MVRARHSLRWMLAALGAVTAMLLWSVAPAVAQEPPDHTGGPKLGAGTGQITGLEITDQRLAGGNSFEDRRIVGVATGTLEGTFVQEVSGMVHKSGKVVFRGTMTFTGTIADCGQGTITLGINGRGEVLVPGFPVTTAHVRVIQQSSSDVAATGTGTVHQTGPALEYELRYRCR